MFLRCAPRTVAASAEATAEPRNPLCKAASFGRFRLNQPRPTTPEAFEAAIDALNAYFDGALLLAPAWSLAASSGGGLECRVRNNRDVPGKTSLRIMLNFTLWAPRTPMLMVRPLPLTATRLPSHNVTFESDDQITPWRECDMILATAGLCAALNWAPVGGIKLNEVKEQAAAIAVALEAQQTCRNPIARRFSTSLAATPLATLWESCQDRQLKELK